MTRATAICSTPQVAAPRRPGGFAFHLPVEEKIEGLVVFEQGIVVGIVVHRVAPDTRTMGESRRTRSLSIESNLEGLMERGFN